jgi:hypothetical protein
MVEAAEDTPAAVEDTASVAACVVVQPADSVVPPLVQA